jgi:hypothetical protein
MALRLDLACNPAPFTRACKSWEFLIAGKRMQNRASLDRRFNEGPE